MAVLLRRSLFWDERQRGFIDHYLVGIYNFTEQLFVLCCSFGVPWFIVNLNPMVQIYNKSNGLFDRCLLHRLGRHSRAHSRRRCCPFA